jgi:hypothetical protein
MVAGSTATMAVTVTDYVLPDIIYLRYAQLLCRGSRPSPAVAGNLSCPSDLGVPLWRMLCTTQLLSKEC